MDKESLAWLQRIHQGLERTESKVDAIYQNQIDTNAYMDDQLSHLRGQTEDIQARLNILESNQKYRTNGSH